MQRKMLGVTAAGACLAFAGLAVFSRHVPEVSFLPGNRVAPWVIFPKPPVPHRQAVAPLPVTFRKEFVLPQAPAAGQVTLAASRKAGLWINGQGIDVPGAARNWKQHETASVPASVLRPGTNLVLVVVTNPVGPPALSLALTAGALRITTDETWQASYAGSVWTPAQPAARPVELRKGSAFAAARHISGGTWIWLAGSVAGALLVAGAIHRRNARRPGDPALGDRSPRWLIGLMFAGLMLLMWNNIALIPPRAGFDTDGHLQYIRDIEETDRLPSADKGWENHQPPLFYVAGALLLKGCQTSATSMTGMLALRTFCMLITLAHLAVVLLGLKTLFPGQPRAQAAGFALAAFLPMQLYLAHYITNEPLAACLMSATLLFCLRLLRQAPAGWGNFLGLGLCLGLAFLTKVTAVVLIPFVVGTLLAWMIRPGQPLVTRIGFPMVALSLAGMICGWHYAAVWREFGHPLFVKTQWAYGVGWWQDPGFHTAGYFLGPGRMLDAPFFSSLISLPAGIYTTMWGDGMAGGTAAWAYRPPWNYDWMLTGFWMALVPSLFIAVGLLGGLRRVWRREESGWLLLALFAGAMLLAIIHLNLVVPTYAVAKAFYGLSALMPLAAFGALGWLVLSRRLPVAGWAGGLLLAAWAATSIASFRVVPGDADTQAQLARTVLGMGDAATAERMLRVNLKQHPGHFESHAFLFDALVRQRQFSNAAVVATATRDRLPDRAQGYLNFAAALEQQQDLAGAVQASRDAIAREPDNPDARLGLCSRLFHSGRYEEAALAAREALRLSPSDPEVHVLLGSALAAESLKEKPGATASGTERAPPPPEEGTPQRELAVGAIGHLRLALALAPEYRDAQNNLAWLLATHPDRSVRDGKAALALAEKASAEPNANPITLRTLAAAHAEVGNFMRASQALDRARALPAPPSVRAKLDAMERPFRESQPFRDGPAKPAEPPRASLLPTDDGYRGIWYYNQPVKSEFKYKYSGGFATYPYQHVPIAIYCPQVERTFFVYGGTTARGAGDKQELLHMVSCFDHRTGQVPRPRILLNKKTDDAHDNPTLQVDGDGYLWVFSSSHGTGRPSYIHKSVKPWAIDEFQRILVSNFSYTQPWHIPGEGFLFLHTRYGGGKKLGIDAARCLFWMTSPNGEKWSEAQMLAGIGQGDYQVSWRSGKRVGTAFDFHPVTGGLNARANIYYAETADLGASWKSVQGEALRLPLTDTNNPALAYDSRADGLLVYLRDVNFDREGRPVILFVTSKGYEPGPENGPREWQTLRWAGREWVRRPMTTSGNNYDHGSLYIEPDGTWRVIAPTDPGPQPYNPGGEMAMWTSSDEGKTWTRTRQMTKGSAYNHTFARRPVEAHPQFYALWADGHGRQPSESSLYFANQSGDVWCLPARMNEDFALPEALQP